MDQGSQSVCVGAFFMVVFVGLLLWANGVFSHSESPDRNCDPPLKGSEEEAARTRSVEYYAAVYDRHHPRKNRDDR